MVGQAVAKVPLVEVATPRAIGVHAGKASFTVGAGEGAVLIITALSRESGPYPLRLRTRKIVDPATQSSSDSRQDAMTRLIPIGEGGQRALPTEDMHRAVTESPMPPGSRVFHLMTLPGDVTVAGNYRPVPARLRALGKAVQIYVDERDAGRVGTDLLREVVATLDEEVIPRLAATLGRAPDVDGDGRFTVLVSDALTRLGGGRLAVDGFVRGADLDPELAAPLGNRCDMLYLSAALGPGPHLRTVIAHEYTHAVVSGMKAFRGPGGTRSGPEEDAWLDEGLAHLVEDQFGFSRSNLDYRVAAFLAAPQRYRLVVDDYYAAGLFRGHGNRGSTYLFLKWCADRYGPDLVGRLARSPRRGVEALEAETGVTFAELFRRWTVALMANGPPGRLGEGYEALDPYGDFGGWTLSGPRCARVRPGEDLAWEALGTAPQFVVVEGGAGAAVEVEGPERAALQVTEIPLPSGAPQISVEVALSGSTERDGTPIISLGLRNPGAGAIRVERLAWEPRTPAANPHATGLRRGSLIGPALASAIGPLELPAHGRLGPVSIALAGARPEGGPVVLKVVGVDSRGRRVAAWADLRPGSSLAGTPRGQAGP